MSIDWSTGYTEVADEPAPSSSGASAENWPVLSPAAYHGLAGEFVACVAPHTEADNVALLLTYLTSFGSAIGRQPYYQIEDTHHYGNLFIVIAGRTSRSRKGTAADRVRRVFETADPDWARGRVQGGLSSGEGLLMPIRDPVYGMKKGVEELIDPGVSDKRLLIDEREFFQALTVMKREGNTLSRVVRDAWDCREVIGSLTKHSRTQATKPYISIIGHITAPELRDHLDHVAMLNGFANRFLFACVRRSKMLPLGGELEKERMQTIGMQTMAAIETAQRLERVTLTEGAVEFWKSVYTDLSKDEEGLMGSVTARAEAHTIRLALVYTLLDGVNEIDGVHLEAALAVWRFSEASARYIFGDMTGDPVIDTISENLTRRRRGGFEPHRHHQSILAQHPRR